MIVDCVILVDNSNVYMEGQKCSAERKGFATTPEQRRPQDPSWRIDFSKLLARLAEGRNIRAAFLVGSRPPPNDDVWEMAKRSGFEVITHDRDAETKKEKAVDTELVAQGTLVIAQTPAPAVLVIASGDRDFLPLVNVAHRLNWTVEMAAFTAGMSNQMAMTVDRVRPLNGSLDLIGHNAFEWPEKS
jgi:uncharacterized LabA/DUF88 family protein